MQGYVEPKFSLRYVRGQQKISAIRLVREVSGLGWRHAEFVVESCGIFSRGLARARADALEAQFAELGAEIEIIAEAKHFYAFDPDHPERGNQAIERLTVHDCELAWHRRVAGSWQRERERSCESSVVRDHVVAAQHDEWAARSLVATERPLEIIERTSARELALEHELRTTTDSRTITAVYADWLQQRGDPRGTIMALALACETASDHRAQLEQELARAYATHAYHLFGPIEDPARHVELEWSRGMVVGIELGRDENRRDSWPEGDLDLLATLLALPICALVRKLWVRSEWVRSSEFTALLAGLGPERLAALRELGVRDRHDYGAKLAGFDWASVSGLERLELTARESRGLALPNLRELVFEPLNRYIGHALETLRASELPRLQVLTIQLGWMLGDDEFGLARAEPIERKMMAEFLRLPLLRSLRSLRFVGPVDPDGDRPWQWLLDELGKAPHLHELPELDLRHAGFGPASRELLDAATRLLPNLVFD